MTSAEIRQSFLDFFQEKKHTIVPSSSLLPDSPNLLFTNAGMNQFVPYFLGEQNPPFDPPRAADTQKCIRAGGKHNDLDDVGFDTYHHTFFEMLGNWSFGDYFKKEAIAWAWELLVERWRFPAERLYATVYQPGRDDPGEFDEEAYRHWAHWFAEAELDPSLHLIRGNRADNFWMMGDTGPCGPCSEIHVDLTPKGDSRGQLVNTGSPLCIEIWNLVFIQLNANPNGTFTPLPATHVDTGMGFERVGAIVEGTAGFTDFQQPVSNYDSTLFRPIIETLSRLSDREYRGSVPQSRVGLSPEERADVAFRVVVDHVRALAFAIADGILPGNTDRNYVVRRILRRAVMFGRDLGLVGTGFLSKLVPVVRENFGEVFPELSQNEKRVMDIISSEEELFNRTLDRGMKLFEEQLTVHAGQEFSPEAAFLLYDTYGFPTDLTEVLARERGLTLNLDRVAELMQQQRDRSRAAQEKSAVTTVGEARPTEFIGFSQNTAEATVTDVQEHNNLSLIGVDRSPFYAEMGGQVSDTGQLTDASGNRFSVREVIREGPTFYLRIEGPISIAAGSSVHLSIDDVRRRKIEANHTATHLLHWALHHVIGTEATQKGSYVGPDRLRFDFSSNPLSPSQTLEVEKLVNIKVLADELVSWVEVPYIEVKNRPDVMQFFGEKYGKVVRVVQIGGVESQLDGFSLELCGGTHVRRTGQIGLFRITSEGAIAAGIRRIEALTGLTAWERVVDQQTKQTNQIKELRGQVLELQKAAEKERAQARQRQAALWVEKLTGDRIVEVIDGAESDYLQAVVNAVRARSPETVAALFGPQGHQINVLVSVPASLSSRLNAGNIVRELTTMLGGKGGGRPDLARGVGKDRRKLPAALARARELIG
jgi:alanyl-tRNA synthetase